MTKSWSIVRGMSDAFMQDDAHYLLHASHGPVGGAGEAAAVSKLESLSTPRACKHFRDDAATGSQF
jgi:hypothetical protein